MKRFAALLTVLALLFCCAACDSDTPSSSPTDITTTDTADTAESSAVTDRTTAATESGKTTLPTDKTTARSQTTTAPVDVIPPFDGTPFVALDNNVPHFTPDEITAVAFESYAPLDRLGRCGVTVACIGRELMPTEARGDIGQVKPTGWHTVKYDCVDGKYLYNRCHLIGFQLAGENANDRNLITGTRYMNVDGMLPFENMVADYVKETDNHVMYRVTPLFIGNELVARGVTMEGYSVEDDGDGICFYVYVYNNQPGVEINYATGDSRLSGTPIQTTVKTTQKATKKTTAKTVKTTTVTQAKAVTYILNTSTHKFHLPSCHSAKIIKAENYREFTGSRDTLIAQGYDPCGNCHP